MPVPFNLIPVNLLTPGQYVEFDNSKAIKGLVAMPQRILIIAPMLATGTATADVPFQLSAAAEGVAKLGRGSIGADMIEAEFDVTDTIETWVLPIADLVGGVTAAGAITVAGPAAAAGIINLYIAGNRLQIGVAAAATAATVASSIVAAINADNDLPVTASALDVVVTITCRHKGTLGNDIDLRANYYPLEEKLPAGIALTFAAMANGAGDTSIATGLAAIGATQYNTVICAFNDATNIALLETELDNRWGPLLQNDGHVHIAVRGTVGSLNTFASARNNPHVTAWSIESNGSPTPLWRVATLAGTVSAFYLGIDPARPLQTLVLPGMLPASAEKRFTRAERNNLLSYGLATTLVNPGGGVQIERAVTLYTQNSYGIVDPSYRDIETMATLSYLRFSVRARIAQKYPRYKLADDSTQYPAGSPIVSPIDIRGEMIALFLDWLDAGLVENLEQFKKDLLVERDATDVNRVNVLLPPDLINQFRVFAGQVQFRL